MFGLLEERLSGTEDIRANGAVAYVLRRHIERSRDLFRAGLKRALLGMISWSTLRLAISDRRHFVAGNWRSSLPSKA